MNSVIFFLFYSSKSISIMREYPLDSDPPTSQATKVDVAERPTAISSMKFSGIIKNYQI